MDKARSAPDVTVWSDQLCTCQEGTYELPASVLPSGCSGLPITLRCFFLTPSGI